MLRRVVPALGVPGFGFKSVFAGVRCAAAGPFSVDRMCVEQWDTEALVTSGLDPAFLIQEPLLLALLFRLMVKLGGIPEVGGVGSGQPGIAMTVRPEGTGSVAIMGIIVDCILGGSGCPEAASNCRSGQAVLAGTCMDRGGYCGWLCVSVLSCPLAACSKGLCVGPVHAGLHM